MVGKKHRKQYLQRMAKRTALLTAVGIRLRMLRSVLNHSQADWARALGITPQMLNRWEQGTRQPSIELLNLICQSTGCTTDFIFRGQLGLDMGRDLREALLNAFASSPYVYLLPEQPPPVAASSAEPRRRRRTKPKAR